MTKKTAAKRKSTTGSSASGVIMGTLAELEIRTSDGETLKIKPRGVLLGWMPKSRQLIVVKNGRKGQGSVSAAAAAVHRRFHNTNPDRADRFEWPDPVGKKETLGRVVSLLYTIPSWLRSPNKKQYRWHHEFGDHGERGHGPVRGRGKYPESLMPSLQIDDAGNLYFKREPGNKYYVTDWLYW